MLTRKFFWSPANGKLKRLIVLAIISFAYLLLSYYLVGFKPDQLFLVFLFNACYLISPHSRSFILGFSIFIVYWIVFDYMKAFPNYAYNAVHIQQPYEFEKTLFGIGSGASKLTPNEYWLQHQSSILDILSGLFYILWIPLPLIFAAYLFYKKREQFFLFILSFVFVNILGWIIYYSYPAAPPWYVQQYGYVFNPSTPGNTAGLGRFDSLLHVSVFKGIYAKSSNVFAAMPSLHSSYPLLVFYYGMKNRLGSINIFFGMVMVGIWFAAVYTSHHYIIDVLAGIFCGIMGILIFNRLSKTKWVNGFMKMMMKATSLRERNLEES